MSCPCPVVVDPSEYTEEEVVWVLDTARSEGDIVTCPLSNELARFSGVPSEWKVLPTKATAEAGLLTELGGVYRNARPIPILLADYAIYSITNPLVVQARSGE